MIKNKTRKLFANYSKTIVTLLQSVISNDHSFEVNNVKYLSQYAHFIKYMEENNNEWMDACQMQRGSDQPFGPWDFERG